MRQGPVFYDPGGKRHRVVSSGSRVAGLAVGVLTTVFVISLLGVSLTKVTALQHPGHLIPIDPKFGVPSDIVTGGRRDELIKLVKQGRANTPANRPVAQRIVGFYNLEDAGYQSFQANVKNLSHFMPQWLNISEQGNSLETDQLDHDINLAAIKSKCAANSVRLEPILTNYEGSSFSSDTAHLLLSNPANMDRLVEEIRAKLIAEKMDGVNVDIENINDADRPGYEVFLAKMAAALHPQKLEVSVDLEAGAGASWQARYTAPCDFGILMAYDQHDENGDSGPISSWGWIQSTVKAVLDAHIPVNKLVLGMGAYSLDWPQGKKGDAQPYSFSEALQVADDNMDEGMKPKDAIQLDQGSQNCYYEYEDEDGTKRICWMQDGISAFNSWSVGRSFGITGFSVWAMGEEDPTIWTFLDRESTEFPDAQKHLEDIHVPYEVSNIGKGDLLSVESRLRDGQRSIHFDAGTGLIDKVEYEKFPSAWVINHHGYVPGYVTLTFDDGPDPNYTPRILDILKRENVKATFFMLGEKMEEAPQIVQRAYAEGHEIGSHTFFHPDLSEVSDRRIALELNATQRSIESIVGRSTILLRPPYNADRDPASEKEVHPIVIADAMGYTIVGESVDPNDWSPSRLDPVTGVSRKRTVMDIVNDTVEMVKEFDQRDKNNRDASNCILLHDAGGDREKTVAALPLIIEALRARGYRFCNVSDSIALGSNVEELEAAADKQAKHSKKPVDQRALQAQVDALPFGANRDRAMPPVPDRDRTYILLDRIAFTTIFTFLQLLALAFITAVTLGILRVAIVVPLALAYERRQRKVTYDPGFRPPVSVVVAAYNEESVIVRTIQSVLTSSYPIDEVIVVDDGSQDGTAEAVRTAFGNDPRVHLIQQENKGKAEALNQTLAASSNEILISVDADTQLPPATVGLLVRHFQNPKIGAVAGNVQVGNMHNVVTTWQGIEYTTSQNMDRRAYGLLQCITVVPGAIGGWRKSAVVAVGGHLDDTLAEDMDLTWRLKIAGWQQETESDAFAYTEAPETIKTFFRQRFRWSYGTLQCLVKHRKALFKHGFFGWFALPVIWLFQIIFQAIAPLVDLQILISLLGFALALFTDSSKESSPLGQSVANLREAATLYLVFFATEMISAMIAYRLERKKFGSLWWLFFQRFVYRQVMYAVIYRSLMTAVRGARQGWGKLDRTARVKI